LFFSKSSGIALLISVSLSLATAQTKSTGASSASTQKKSSATQATPASRTGEQGKSSQTKPPADADRPASSSQSKSSSGPSESAVPPTAAVITIEGLCDTPAPSLNKPAAKPQTPQSCQTQITRAEFEKLLSRVAPPNANADIKKRIADTYARLLTMAKQGEKLAVDKDPDFQEQLEIIKLQLKAQWAERKIDADASKISDDELKAYYESNGSAYEEATLDRIFVPKTPQPPASASAPGATPSGASTAPATPASDPQRIAEQARQQLQKGDDPAKVQATAFQQVNSKADPPQTKREHVRRGAALPPTDEPKIFALKPGEVSEVISDPIGYSVYKMQEKKQLPFEAVKNDIKTLLVSQRMKDKLASVMSSTKTELNESYFGASQPSQSASPQPKDQVRPLSGQQSQAPQSPQPKGTPPGSSGASTPPKK
jgi:peptidyl-prolyl cis-trans isomerase C